MTVVQSQQYYANLALDKTLSLDNILSFSIGMLSIVVGVLLFIFIWNSRLFLTNRLTIHRLENRQNAQQKKYGIVKTRGRK